MIIALDWDNTYTAAPYLFECFIEKCKELGIQVVIVTGRKPEHRIHTELDVPIVYAGNEYKRKAAEKAGYKVNIWIDDMPEMIGESMILTFN